MGYNSGAVRFGATNFTERANEMGQPRQRHRAAGAMTSFAALA
ncbi:hypothetical protein FORC2_p095 (plasmid) [Yersinia enterocolitica]|nr:hypothetical protein FORC2_p086 [Yersinia enterocolitica]AKF40373.1 hypothetical protein FORC2_p095 [Yersinia enterocolitica]